MKEFQMGESPSVNCIASARGLAKMAAFMANRGTFDGSEYISEETWDKFHLNPTAELFNGVSPIIFSNGGAAHFGPNAETEILLESTPDVGKNQFTTLNAGREGFIGWMG
jgi:hypothetical protein